MHELRIKQFDSHYADIIIKICSIDAEITIKILFRNKILLQQHFLLILPLCWEEKMKGSDDCFLSSLFYGQYISNRLVIDQISFMRAVGATRGGGATCVFAPLALPSPTSLGSTDHRFKNNFKNFSYCTHTFASPPLRNSLVVPLMRAHSVK